MSFDTTFQHAFRAGDPGKAPLLLLHGTGGNEQDLFGLAEAVAPGRAMLSPRGQVSENGMPRFFRRFAEGKFDEEDIIRRAADLAGFISAAREAYGISAPVALGFSNGANIAAALLALHSSALRGAVLLRAMAPFKTMPPVKHDGTKVLLISGASDTMIPLGEAKRLVRYLSDAGADMRHVELPAGHGLTQSDLAHMTKFFAEME